MSEGRPLHVEVESQVPWPLNTAESQVQVFTERVLQAAATHLKISGEVSVLYVDDQTIHSLNQTYRQVDRPTDVLSFAMQEGEDPFPELDEAMPMLGDIVISVETAIAQAASYEHSVERELAFLLVHGFLHLNGFDHADESSEREMFGLQEEVLQHLGLPRE